jgi:Methyltransferase domain
MATTPEQGDPELSGYSLASVGEVLFPCLDAVSPASVAEVGSYAGEFTGDLLAWANRAGARVIAIDPEPQPELEQLSERHSELELVREPSHEALAQIPVPDAVIIDGDHNYYTVSEELRLLDERAGANGLPLVMFHDVCWPHARRDTYYEPDRIPEEHRQPLAQDAKIAPGERGIAASGLHYPWAAAREGGPGNGVLTAVEDYVEAHRGLRLAIVPAFFGFGVLWRQDASWAQAVGRILEPWDDNPILARLEANRVAHIIDRIRFDEQQALLRSFLHSRAFTWAERLSRLKQRGEPIFSREQVRRVLGD